MTKRDDDEPTAMHDAVWLATILYIIFIFALAWVAIGTDDVPRRVQATWVRP